MPVELRRRRCGCPPYEVTELTLPYFCLYQNGFPVRNVPDPGAADSNGEAGERIK